MESGDLSETKFIRAFQRQFKPVPGAVSLVGNAKTVGKQVRGTPSESDIELGHRILDLYEKVYPGRLAKIAADYDIERRLSGRNEYGEISNASEHRKIMWLTPGLTYAFKRAFPSLWVEPKHLHWFLRQYPVFMGGEKL